MAPKVLVTIMIAIVVVVIVNIVAGMAIMLRRGFTLGLHYTDCIVYIVRIVLCGLYYADCII